MTKSRQDEAGFTLVELIIVIVVIGVLSAYAAMSGGSAGAYTALSQAQTMASNLRHAQTLATTIGKSLRVTRIEGANGTYSVSCVVPGAFPCNNGGGAMTNPATGSPFTVTLEKNVALTGTAELVIDSLGRPGDAASYELRAAGTDVFKNVSVAPLTGLVSVQ